MAALDILGYLPAPAGRFNRGAADMLEGELLAIGACSSVAVLELPRLQAACMLQGGHRGAAVTAVKWLASGDSAGGVVLWDVLSTSIIARLDDVPAAQQLLDDYAAASRGECCIEGLAWVLPQPGALAVVVSPALLLIWDTTGGGLIWKRELAPLSSPEVFTSICCDPLDRRRVVLCGEAGALLVMRLRGVGRDGRGGGGGAAAGAGGEERDLVEQRQYRVNVAAAAKEAPGKDQAADKLPPLTLQARFCADRDLLVVLLPRELLVFDLELGQPAASSALGGGRQPFSHLLGVYGEGVSQGLGDEGGIDFVYCAHVDGSLSCWTRRPGELAFRPGPATKLVAPQLKGSRGPQATMVAVCCALWRDELLGEGGTKDGPPIEIGRLPPVAATTQSIARQLATAVGGQRPDEEGAPRGGRGGGAAEGRLQPQASLGASSGCPFSGRSLLVMVVSSDGRVWQWDLPVPKFPRKGFVTSTEDTPITFMAQSIQARGAQSQITQQQIQQQASLSRASPEAVPPQLTGLLHGLPSGIVCFTMHPRPLLLPSAHAGHAAAAAAAEAVTEAAAAASAAAAQGGGAAGSSGGGAERASYAPRRAGSGAGLATGSSFPLLSPTSSGASTPFFAPRGGGGGGGGAAQSASGDNLSAPLARVGVDGAEGNGGSGGGGDGGGDQGVEALHEVLLGAAGTVSGSVEVFVVQRGLVNPLSVEVALSLAVHREPVRGIAWLGPLPLLASYAAERGGAGGGGGGAGGGGGGGAGAQGWRNIVALTCMITRRSVAFRSNTALDAGPLVALRASPSGAYLLMVFRGAPAELWSTGVHEQQQQQEQQEGRGPAPPGSLPRPHRLRFVDLPFGAADWALPADATAPWELQSGPPHTSWRRDGGADSAGGAGFGADGLGDEDAGPSGFPLPSTSSPDASMRRGARRRGAAGDAMRGSLNTMLSMQVAMSSTTAPLLRAALSGQHQSNHPSDAAAPARPAGAPEADMPEERLAFALTDGRSGLLTVQGRKVTDSKPKRPAPGPGPQPQDLLGTCVAAAGQVSFLGDGEGTVLCWDTATGKCSAINTGMGAVRAMAPAPPPCPLLHPSGDAGLDLHVRMRLAVMFAGGAFGVVEVDSGFRLRLGVAPPQVCMQRVGSALGIGWAPLPGPIGAGSVLAAALRDGSLALLDTCQGADRRPSYRARLSHVRSLLSERRGPIGGASAAHTPAAPGASWPATPGSHRPGGAPPAAGTAFEAALASAGATTGAGDTQSLPLPARALVGLAPPKPLGSALLMRRPWALLLRLALQLGLSQESVLYISSPSTEEDEDVERELSNLLPSGAREQLARAASARGADEWGWAQGGLGLHPSSGALAPISAETSPTPAGGEAGGLSYPLGGSSGSLSQQDRLTPAPTPRGPTAGPLRGQGSGRPALARAATRTPFGGDATRAEDGEGSAAAAAAAAGSGSGGGGGAAFDGRLAPLLRHIGRLRSRGHLLHPDEWRAYTQALGRGGAAERMAVAARVAGDPREARFWTHLPATLAAVWHMHDAICGAKGPLRQPSAAAAAAEAAAEAGAAGAEGGGALDRDDYDRLVSQALEGRGGGSGAPGGAAGAAGPGDAGRRPGRLVVSGPAPRGASAPFGRGNSVIKQVAAGRAVRLWDEDLTLADAQERALWHEAMPRAVFDAPRLLESRQAGDARILEYAVLGDIQTAVAFLLSTNPERNEHYYRNAAITLALAAVAAPPGAAAAAAAAGGGGRGGTAAAAAAGTGTTLHVQAAKVLSAHAASMGDTLLAVPLSISAGLITDAVVVLQEEGLWRLAASLIARGLRGTERATALQRWAQHVLRSEGSTWRAVGLLTAAGCLRGALGVLRGAGLPDCAAAYLEACRQAGLVYAASPPAQQQQEQQQEQQQQGADDVSPFGGEGTSPQQRQQQQQQEERPPMVLFDILGGMYGGLHNPGSSGYKGSAAGGDEVAATETEFDAYCCSLLSHL